MRTRIRSKIVLLFVVFAALLAIPAVVWAAELVTAEVVDTANDVTVTQGDTANFNIKLSATGKIDGTITSANASTAKVNTSYSLDNSGNLTSSTPSSAYKFYSSGSNCSGGNCDVTWDGGTSTPYSQAATITAGSSTPVGSYSIHLSPAAGTTQVTNPSISGGKLSDSTETVITVHVVAPPPPSDTTAPVITKVVTPASPDGSNGWYKSNVSVDWTVSDPESAISSQSGCTDFSVTSDQPATTYTCTATSAGGTSSDSVTIKRDATAPGVNCGSADGNWHAGDVDIACTASDARSGLADATNDASFNLSTSVTAGNETNNASTNSRTVLDNAGNSATAGPISGNKVDKKAPSFLCDAPDGVWHATNASLDCTASDGGSGLSPTSDANFSRSTTVASGTVTNNASTGTKTLTDAVGNSATAGSISGNKVDRKAPALVSDGATTSPDGTNNWYKTAVTNSFTATDGGSGFAPSGALTYSFNKSSGTNEGAAVTIASGAVSDAVGNSTASIDSAAFKIDLSNPYNVTFVGGPAADGSYDFGDTPAAPTCTAEDAVSGFASCAVTGYSTAVGPHTMTATAKDNAGRTATATRFYTVNPYTLNGFYQPIDMNDTVNTVKNGSAVPVKFELFKGTTELTSTSAVSSISARQVSCTAFNGEPTDEIEYLAATGGTSLRYDATAGQFVYNWQTPKGTNQVGKCYTLTMTAADSSTLVADFKLK